RNHDFGDTQRNRVSRLSPWMRHRLLLEDDLLAAVLNAHDARQADAFVQEVFWRGYFRGHLEHRPAIWKRYCAERDKAFVDLAGRSARRAAYDTAVTGTTRLECYDTWVQELTESGYLHNHARMWFASIWLFTLKLPWQLGADFFLQHLIDGDPASNTCSWRWVAGLHTVGKTYLATADNITKYTGGRFNKVQGLAQLAVAQTEPELPTPQPPVFESAESIPTDCRLGLLVVESDCQPDSLPLPQPPQAVLTLTDPCNRSIQPLSARASEFTRAALTSAADTAANAFAVPVHCDASGDWHNALRTWAAEHTLDALAVARPPVGWVQDRLAPALHALEREGIRVIRITRQHDRAVWPHAAKGYFKLKKQIPTLLRTLGLDGNTR
ncbi:MAG: FAD-binding domain-containing protein, partial [Pseudomonadota bacterium]